MRKAAAILLVNGLFLGCGAAREPEAADESNAQGEAVWRPVSPAQSYLGKSHEEWGVAWKLWGFAQTSCDSPGFDEDGSLCGLYQDPEGPAFFLDFSVSDKPRTRCTIPAGKAIVVPMMTFFNDNAGVPEPKTEAELLASVEEAFASMTDLRLRVDGVAIQNLADYGFGPVRYAYEIPPEPNWYSCNGTEGVSDTIVDPSFLAGFVAVLPPPPTGKHRLEYGGVITYEGEEYALSADTTFVIEADEGD